MRPYRMIAISFLLISTFALVGFSSLQTTQVDRKQLREMLVQLGYDVNDIVKDPGKEKYSVTLTKEGLDIPIGYEVSPSGQYIWLTVNLGSAPQESSTKCFALLKQNAKVQPSQFYITESGRMMLGMPVLNRNITNADLRKFTDTVSDNVAKTKDVWQK